MPRLVDSFLAEFEQEVPITRRVLERVPANRLDWKPHTKSFTLGKLAQHVATVPVGFARFLINDSFDAGDFKPQPDQSLPEIMAAFDGCIAEVKRILPAFDDQKMMGTWSFTKQGKVMMSAPRIAIMRSLMLNHWYHHRGQLSVYLRLLDGPVPSIYGPSADENPFA